MFVAKALATALVGIFISEVFVPTAQSLLKIKDTADKVESVTTGISTLLNPLNDMLSKFGQVGKV